MTTSEAEPEKKLDSNSRDDETWARDYDVNANTQSKSPAQSDLNERDFSEEGEIEESNDLALKRDQSCKTTQEESEDLLAPPLPSEPPPQTLPVDDGWAPIWEEKAQGFYFFNRFTGATQWTNPRVPEVSAVIPTQGPPGVDSSSLPSAVNPPPPSIMSGYNPAIHGDYDPEAWYAKPADPEPTFKTKSEVLDAGTNYTATAAFNRFTGRFQNPDITPDNFNDENKSKRQMNAYFDVDAAANSHDGRSLKAERSGKKLSKTELKQFKEKRKMKKEQKKRAWLRD